MGKRTSIYLTTELAAAISASGKPLAELLWRGLDSLPLADQAELRLTPGEVQQLEAALDCPHPRARVHKGLCGLCGTNVSAR